jgi:integrase
VEHVIRRAGRYHYRRRVPADLINAYGGKKEFQKALGTADPKQAAKLKSQIDVEFNELFDGLRAGLSKTGHTPQTGAQWPAFSQAEAEQMEDSHYQATHPTESEEQEHDRYVAAKAEREQRLADIEEVVRRITNRNAGQPIQQPPASIPATHVAESLTKPSTGLIGILPVWQKARQPDSSTVATMHMVISRFHEVAGKHPARSYTRQHVIDFQQSLADMGLAPATVRKQIALLRTLFGVDPTIGNPTQGIRTEGKSTRGTAKPPFSHADLNLIFASPVYSEGLRPVPGCGEAAYWLPLLGLFTGARLEELGQLSPKDIREETYRDGKGIEKTVPVIYVTDEGTGQGIKNAASHRRIPIHKALLDLGFLKYVASQKGARLFPAMTPDKYGRETSKFSSWFPKYLRANCPDIDKRKSFHSFRHLFKDICREYGIDKGVRDSIQGHSEGDSAGDYGGQFHPLRPLVEAIAKYKVAGVKLPG